jgi:hypothetical protein
VVTVMKLIFRTLEKQLSDPICVTASLAPHTYGRIFLQICTECALGKRVVKEADPAKLQWKSSMLVKLLLMEMLTNCKQSNLGTSLS